MSELIVTHIIADPLSEVARKERRNLLAASTAALVVTTVGLVPTKLAALGVEFAPPAQSSFLVIFAVVVGYFMIAFTVYGLADFFAWREKYQDYLVNREAASQSWSYEDQLAHDELHRNIPRAAWLYRWNTPLAFIRITFKFIVPLAAGATAVCFLLLKVLRL